MRLALLLAMVFWTSCSGQTPHKHQRTNNKRLAHTDMDPSDTLTDGQERSQSDMANSDEPVVEGEEEDGHTHLVGGVKQCGEYSNEMTIGGHCRLTATLPQLDEHRCPDMFRCTDEVSYWLQENQERRRQVEDLKEIISELQEELRSHRHKIRALEHQEQDRKDGNASLEQRFRVLELQSAEADALLRIQGVQLQELQVQVHNLSAQAEQRSHIDNTCVVIPVRNAPLLSTQEAHHPEVHSEDVRNCPVDCAALYHNGVHDSGVYTVVPALGYTPVQVFCDMETAGGGWTVFQRRKDGRVDFNRGWQDYQQGFGELRGEHWLGLEHLHHLSTQGHYSLRIDLEDWGHRHKHALYQDFSIDDEENEYRLHVSGFSGTVEDSFGWYHDRQGFSTPDRGNICAEISHGGWWYHQCFYANLNGVYYKRGRYSSRSRSLLGPDGVVWYSWTDSDYYSLKTVTMMIRPSNFRPGRSP